MLGSESKTELKISLISLHGLIRGQAPELGRDADTGGQVKYVLELARELSVHPRVARVELLTRQIFDPKVGEDYAVAEERLTERAAIVRIPFGPKRYLKKEALWPYIEMFVDQTLIHFRRTRIPDIIHGHYADAGLAGAQLARLLHVPYIFTGHSLGRVKRQRLTLQDQPLPDSLEQTYKFDARYEAEETALETASMVVTSTSQEVSQQYQLYDHYQPARMDVIPPGVDLEAFSPPAPGWSSAEVTDELARFLRQPLRPMILTLARPDERKNLEKLVDVYGQSTRLQAMANLVIVMGSRDDLRELPKGQQTVISNVLYLIDKYDLYGLVAYPKHNPSNVADLYRWATVQRGVFVNPALTEPFGLTLLEAGAVGLPIVATCDGGPTDIIANCQNGLLIDPLDEQAIEEALYRALSDREQWDQWSKNGIAGTRQHYSWRNHTTRYLSDLQTILETSPVPALAKISKYRRLPEFDRIIVTDLDNTLTGDDAALADFIELLRTHPQIGFGVATGRCLNDALQLIEHLRLPKPDVLDTDVGTQLHYGENLTPDLSWRKQIGYAWKPDQVRQLLDAQPGLVLQPAENLSEFKISYEIDPSCAPSLAAIKKILRTAGLRTRVTLSLGIFWTSRRCAVDRICRCDTCSTNGALLLRKCWWPATQVTMKGCCWAGRWEL
jgi:sucrose-phosphate synthase